MTPRQEDIALNILGNVIRAVGPQWEVRLTEADRALVRTCCGEAARLAVRALATPRNRDLQLELMRERARLHASLYDCLALGEGRLAETFWDGFRNTVNNAVAVAFAAL